MATLPFLFTDKNKISQLHALVDVEIVRLQMMKLVSLCLRHRPTWCSISVNDTTSMAGVISAIAEMPQTGKAGTRLMFHCIWTCQVSFPLVNYYIIYNYQFGACSVWIILYTRLHYIILQLDTNMDASRDSGWFSSFTRNTEQISRPLFKMLTDEEYWHTFVQQLHYCSYSMDTLWEISGDGVHLWQASFRDLNMHNFCYREL